MPRIVVALTLLATLVAGGYWVVPAALSYYAAAKAPAVARVVPTELRDRSISPAAGQEVSYFGYKFDVPWTDLDETATRLYPKGKPQKSTVILEFHSGLHVMLTAISPGELVRNVCKEMNISPAELASAFGADATNSDFSLVKTIYQFSPAHMHHWGATQRERSREQVLLILKSLLPLKAAESGIFNLQSGVFEGFQQGDPAKRPSTFAVTLYSDQGTLEFVFSQKDFKSQTGVTQPEINRIVQSLRKAPDTQAPDAQLKR